VSLERSDTVLDTKPFMKLSPSNMLTESPILPLPAMLVRAVLAWSCRRTERSWRATPALCRVIAYTASSGSNVWGKPRVSMASRRYTL